jgi:hypothetical protein
VVINDAEPAGGNVADRARQARTPCTGTTPAWVPPPQWTTPEHLARPGTIRNGLTSYATSKLGVIYLVHAFARRTGLETYSFNPAFTPGTDLMRDDRVGDAFFRHVGPRLPRVNTQEQAGAQLAAVAIGPRPAEPGAYIDRWDVTQSSPESYDERREEELWSGAERLTAPAIA